MFSLTGSSNSQTNHRENQHFGQNSATFRWWTGTSLFWGHLTNIGDTWSCDTWRLPSGICLQGKRWGTFWRTERLRVHCSHVLVQPLLEVIVICLLLAPSAGEPILCMASMPVRKSQRTCRKGMRQWLENEQDKLSYGDKTNMVNYLIYFLKWIYMQIKNKIATYCEYTDI